jgi:hypothetical protein
LSDLLSVLDQAAQVPSIRSIYFEGGEPFLFYPILAEGIRAASDRGFDVGVVTNGYWARTVEDALLWLAPVAERLADVSVSTDLLHSKAKVSPESRNVLVACEQLGIPAAAITCELPAGSASGEPQRGRGQPVEGGGIMYRGRAAVRLAQEAPHRSWESFDECPHEDLEAPERVHLDPLGNLHLCQGLVMGNLFERPLQEILESYRVSDHPIAGPLAAAGPAELVRVYDVPHAAAYADACALCYAARLQLRPRFPTLLGPDAMYGVGLT